MKEQYPVMEGAEPFYFEGDKTGVLVIHGFTGTTQSVRSLGESFNQAGFTVFGPRLRGHGTHYEDMERSTYIDWCETVDEGYHFLKETCDDIYIAGLSMGGTLTLHLAEQYPQTKGIILINAAIDIPEMSPEAVPAVRFLDAIGSDIKKENVEELAYEKTPVKSLGEIQQLVKETRQKLPQIQVPARIFVSEVDHVVPPENSSWIYDRLASEDKRLIPMEDSYHVATLDNNKEKIAIESIAFINGLTSSATV
ncbi:alpha/beta hydrolase [Alteribacillus bidgolensis]|uniref:Carboxylesterase n=1 Tax=Alteribacillus bidgolensis TaxID=930129 RepID=A0A1G8GYK0_9BACI|nr:alpha/beta fold hydrolase [Alteribacillus bidgolensis]SDH99429.1 carboxylesterase [Alteribacillus bidgolensis]